MPETIGRDYDIMVIGAGPAGSSAARTAAQMGLRVLLIDKKQHPGFPVRCAELVSQWVLRHTPFPLRSIIQSVETMIIHFPDGSSREMKCPGYMLDRSRFDKEWASSAVLAGAEISMGTKALRCSSQGVLIEKGAQKEWVRSKVVIGADGVHSTVARLAAKPPVRQMVALQYEIILFEPQSHVDIYFHPDYEGGYAWFFPKGNSANAGIGTIPSKTHLLPELLSGFLNHLKKSGKLPRIEIVSKTGGSIPCQPREQTAFENILLVGDAAGHAHPITGAGILNAIIGGEIAGRVSAEAVNRGELSYLEQYETKWREIFGKTLQYGYVKRNFLEENWKESGFDFKILVRKTWAGFKEYYQDRKKSLHSPL